MGATVWVGPQSGDEVSVPAKERVRLDEEASPLRMGEQAREPGEQRPVSWMERWSVHLASKDRNLVAQHDDLDRELTVVTTCEPDQIADAQNQ